MAGLTVAVAYGASESEGFVVELKGLGVITPLRVSHSEVAQRGCQAVLILYLTKDFESLLINIESPLAIALPIPSMLMASAAIEQCRLAATGEQLRQRVLGRPTWLPYAGVTVGFIALGWAAARATPSGSNDGAARRSET